MEASPQQSTITELAELALALLLAYNHSGAGNHNALRLTNGAEQKFLTLTLTKINNASLLQKYINGN